MFFTFSATNKLKAWLIRLITKAWLGWCIMSCDAVVIGAGIEGSATAYYLLKKGLKDVLVLEQVYMYVSV